LQLDYLNPDMIAVGHGEPRHRRAGGATAHDDPHRPGRLDECRPFGPCMLARVK
jgi:hypothetical protein